MSCISPREKKFKLSKVLYVQQERVLCWLETESIIEKGIEQAVHSRSPILI